METGKGRPAEVNFHTCTCSESNYCKIPTINPGDYICSKGLFVIFLETLFGILVEEAYFRGGRGWLIIGILRYM